MKKEYLEMEKYKYIHFKVSSDSVSYLNNSFEKLFRYIGENIDMGRKRYEGNAYAAIRKRTDELLLISNRKCCRLKTSKYEIKTIRKCFGHPYAKNYVMKIPFKSTYIFSAIIELVNDIKQRTAFPNDLNRFISLCYGFAFYNDYIKTYESCYDEIKMDYHRNEMGICMIELHNDFNSDDSPFMVEFV